MSPQLSQRLTYFLTLRGDDAESTQLPDVFCLASMAGSRQGTGTKALCYVSDSSKMNSEGRAEIGAALRHKEDPNKCLVFALALFMRHRFVTMDTGCAFKWEWFVPRVIDVDGQRVIQWRWWDQYLIFGNGRTWDGFVQGSIETLTGLMGKVCHLPQGVPREYVI
jgi:hypothetical protein|tara:strand:- start:104 stop:598 length:495 start_codon:yes stop_codon:yes gene_type:complete